MKSEEKKENNGINANNRCAFLYFQGIQKKYVLHRKREFYYCQ